MFLASFIICLIIGIVISAVSGLWWFGIGFGAVVFFTSLPGLLKYAIFYDGVNSINSSAKYRQEVSDRAREKAMRECAEKIGAHIKGGKQIYKDNRKLNLTLNKK